MQVAFFCWFTQGVAGMSRYLGRDVLDLEKLYARELWADFSFPKVSLIKLCSWQTIPPKLSMFSLCTEQPPPHVKPQTVLAKAFKGI